MGPWPRIAAPLALFVGAVLLVLAARSLSPELHRLLATVRGPAIVPIARWTAVVLVGGAAAVMSSGVGDTHGAP